MKTSIVDTNGAQITFKKDRPTDINNIRVALERREELLNNEDVPKQSELYKNLGNSLGQIVIENMNPYSKELMGVTRLLKGPPNNLWLPPSSRIKNEMMLIPPTPADITKAFLHQEILEVGSKMEAKVEESCLKRIRKTAMQVSEFERFESERRLKFALECLRQEHQQEIRYIVEQHQKAVSVLREDLRKEYDRGQNDCLLKFRSCCNNISNKTQEIAVQTEPIVLEQHNSYKVAEMENKHKQMNKILKCLYDDFKEHLKIQRHFLACTRITELMHVICAQKLDAQKRIQKIMEIFNEEISRVADPTAWRLIKDKYISVLNKMSMLARLVQGGTPEHQKFLTDLENEIQQDIIGIEFQENLCHCCEGVKKLIRQNNNETSPVQGPTGLIIFPHSLGEKIFCTCYSTSEDEDADLKQRLFATIDSKKKNCAAEALWSSLSESNVASSTSSPTKSTSTTELPVDSDLLLAKKIAGLVNIEDILATAFSELADHGLNSSDTLNYRLADYVSQEFKDKFNPDAILSVISTIHSQRTQSLIMGARDSLELVKAKRNTNSRISAHHEIRTYSFNSLSTESCPSSIISVKSPSSATTLIENEKGLDPLEIIKVEVSENRDQNAHKDVLLLSEQRRSSCCRSEEVEEDINETNLKKSITEQEFLKQMVRTPKYLVPPASYSDPNWIYHKCTETEWNQLVDKYTAEILKQDESSSNCYDCATVKSDVEEADPKLLKDVVDAYNKCRKVPPHPLGKLRIRSLIALLEQNEEVNKLLHKKICNNKTASP